MARAPEGHRGFTSRGRRRLVIFVDTNVFMYAVGREHPLREPSRQFFQGSLMEGAQSLVTSAEVLQELLHAYLPVGRFDTLDAALELVEAVVEEIWAVEPDDVRDARELVDRFPSLGARDLLHVASCRRRGITQVRTHDRALEVAFR